MKMKLAHLGVVALFAGCGGGSLQNKAVSSVGNLFTYSANPKSYDGTDNESWSPTTTQAWVSWSGTALTGGSVEVQLFDSTGAAVGNETATPASVPAGQATSVGVAGAWRIDIAFNGATGSLSLNIEGSTGGMP